MGQKSNVSLKKNNLHIIYIYAKTSSWNFLYVHHTNDRKPNLKFYSGGNVLRVKMFTAVVSIQMISDYFHRFPGLVFGVLCINKFWIFPR